MSHSEDPLAWLESLEGVPSAFAAARDGIDAVLRDRGLRRTSPETTAESLLRGAHASAVLEGSSSSLPEVRAGEGDQVARDAVRVSTGLLALAPTLLAVAAAGAGPAAHPGRGGLGAGRRARSAPRRRRPPSGCRAWRGCSAARRSTPALLVAAVVHADLVTAAPFASHNGVVARAAERLVLVAKGVDEKSLTVPEAGHLALRPEYESNLRGLPRRRPERRARLAALRGRGLRRRRRGEPAATARRGAVNPFYNGRNGLRGGRTHSSRSSHSGLGYQGLVTSRRTGVHMEHNNSRSHT